MRLALISYHICPFSLLGSEFAGGMSVYLKELSQALSFFQKVKIDLYTRVINPACVGPKRFSPGVKVIHLSDGPARLLSPAKIIENYDKFSQRLISYLRQEKKTYDLLFTHYWLSGLIGYRLKSEFGWPLIHSFHTVAKEKLKNTSRKEPYFRAQAEDFITGVADGFICHSPEEKEILLRDFNLRPEKIGVIPPGINHKLFFPERTNIFQEELGFSREDRILLYVGRLVPEKGLSVLIRALSLLRKHHPLLFSQLKMVIIGGGMTKNELHQQPYARELFSLVERHHLSHHVYFLGSRPYEKLRLYYGGAEGLILPSYYESFGLVAFEAMACGTPVLVPRLGVFPRMIKTGQNGLLFQPGSSKDLAEKIVWFLQTRNSFWPSDLIGLEVRKKLNWEKTARGIYFFLKEIISPEFRFKTRFQPDERLRHTQNSLLPPSP